MSGLRFTLLSDGGSDRVLIPILTWLLDEAGVAVPINGTWANLAILRKPPRNLAERILRSIDLFPCDILFVHRDAERQDPANRRLEIVRAHGEMPGTPTVIPVIPVRMTEAWICLDEQAIRQAVGNRNGGDPLQIPRPEDIESLANPKKALYELLRAASGYGTARLRSLHMSTLIHRVAELTQDFSHLRAVPAFAQLEGEVQDLVRSCGWSDG